MTRFPNGGRPTKVDAVASVLSRAPDGQRFACAGHGYSSIARDGTVLVSSRDNHIFNGKEVLRGDLSLLALDGATDVWNDFDRSYLVTRAVTDPEEDQPGSLVLIRGRLTPHELIATDGLRLLACDATSWETTGEIDLRADPGPVAVAPAARRVAVVTGPEIVVLDAPPATR